MNTRHFAVPILGLAVALGNCLCGVADELLLQLKAEHRQRYSRATFSPDGRFVASVGGHFLRIYDSKTKKVLADCPVALPEPYSSTLRHVAISPDGRRVATSDLRMLEIRDVDTEELPGSLMSPLRGLSFSRAKLEFSPDGALLVAATASSESTLPIFRVDQIIGDKSVPGVDAR